MKDFKRWLVLFLIAGLITGAGTMVMGFPEEVSTVLSFDRFSISVAQAEDGTKKTAKSKVIVNKNQGFSCKTGNPMRLAQANGEEECENDSDCEACHECVKGDCKLKCDPEFEKCDESKGKNGKCVEVCDPDKRPPGQCYKCNFEKKKWEKCPNGDKVCYKNSCTSCDKLKEKEQELEERNKELNKKEKNIRNEIRTLDKEISDLTREITKLKNENVRKKNQLNKHEERANFWAEELKDTCNVEASTEYVSENCVGVVEDAFQFGCCLRAHFWQDEHQKAQDLKDDIKDNERKISEANEKKREKITERSEKWENLQKVFEEQAKVQDELLNIKQKLKECEGGN